MPTNLPPEYFEVEKRFRAAASMADKIGCLEELIATIPKHKGTDKLRSDLRRKLSKLKAETESKKRPGKHESAFHVEKEGAARVLLIGAPNVGKSALVAALTHASPKVSEFPFTTWKPTPGMMPVYDIQVQLVDTPPMSRKHVEPELFNLVRTGDLVLLVVDLQADPIQQLEEVSGILHEHRVSLSSDKHSISEDGHLVSIPCIVLANKNDDESSDPDFYIVAELAEHRWPLLSISAMTGRNFENLKRMVFERLGKIRVYSKLPAKEPDMSAPFVLDEGATVADFAASVHKDFATNLKTARAWGTDVHDGETVGSEHILHDGDVVELHM